MKLNIITALFFLLLTQGCQQEGDGIFDLEQEIPGTVFKEDALNFGRQIILNAKVVKNMLYLLNPSFFTNFTADSEEDPSSPLHFTTLSYFKKHCISKNYMALSPSYANSQLIQFNSTNENLFFWEEIGLYINRVGGVPGDSTLDYTQYNTTAFDNTAINEFDNAVLPVIKKTDTSAIVFILFDLRALVGSANPDNVNFPYNERLNLPKEKYTEIIFPQEANHKINRIESFQQNFYVSTAENTYLIRPDGSLQFLMEGSANDFFEYDGKIYADFGDRISFTPDDGKTWQTINNTAIFSEFREFQDVYGHLIFFHEDKLYLVNPDDFSFSILNNEGLQGSKITAVLPFYQRVYVATLSGLFHKPIENLEQ